MNRKHIIAVCAFVLCAAVCIAAAAAWPRAEAGEEPGTTEPGMTEPGTEDPILLPVDILPFQPVGFKAQYIRTDGYREGVRYPIVKIIRSVEELNKYYETNRGQYNLDHSGWTEACGKYDEAYFEEHILVMVLVEAGSGSVRYQVINAVLDGDELIVDIDVQAPEVGTCDMAEWHILIEPATDVDVADEEHVTVNLRTTGMGKLPGNDAIREKITEEQAVEIARAAVFAAPDFVGAQYDVNTGVLSVQFDPDGGVVSLRLPESWRYHMEPTRLQDDGTRFTLHIGPESYDAVIISCNSSFGVCGTGLTEKTIRLGDYDAVQGMYKGGAAWDFITLEPTEHTRLVILNQCRDGTWWNRYGAETMEVLNTLTVDETERLQFETVVTVPWDTVKSWFDEETCTWQVNFSREDYAGGDQTVTLDEYGTILGSVYGE